MIVTVGGELVWPVDDLVPVARPFACCSYCIYCMYLLPSQLVEHLSAWPNSKPPPPPLHTTRFLWCNKYLSLLIREQWQLLSFCTSRCCDALLSLLFSPVYDFAGDSAASRPNTDYYYYSRPIDQRVVQQDNNALAVLNQSINRSDLTLSQPAWLFCSF